MAADARSVLLIPGMMCDARALGPQAAALAKIASVRVAAPTASATIAGIARDALRDCPFPRFRVVGFSMGGIVAMEMLRQSPGRITGLALLDTGHLPESAAQQARRRADIERANSGALLEMLEREFAPLYLAPENGSRTDLIRLVVEMGSALGPEVFERQSLAVAHRVDSTATLAGFAGPALVLCGRHDRLCPPSLHERMAALPPRGTLRVIDNAGHLAPLENPDAVNRALEEWLEEESA